MSGSTYFVKSLIKCPVKNSVKRLVKRPVKYSAKRCHCRAMRALRRFGLPALFALAVPFAGIGAGAAPAAPERAAPQSQGFSPTRLARIGARMQEAVDAGVMVGGQALIARRGQLVYSEVWGQADREKKTPMAEDALYRIYSMTKPITSVALLMLYEEGRFLLSDPVETYLPEFAGLTLLQENGAGEPEPVAPRRPPTIRDLLRHSAGLSYGVFGDTAVDRRYREADLFRAATLGEFTRRLAQLPLLYEPGTRWHYSVAVDVQGRLVEVIGGLPFGEFLRRRIFAPLGMEDTFFVVPQDKRSRLAQLYSPLGTKLDWSTPWTFSAEQRLVPADPELTRAYLDGSRFESGGAGLVSTADDYLRFALMLAGGGAYRGVRLLAPGTVRHMQGDHIQDLDSRGLWNSGAFGLGVGIVGDTAGKSGELGAAQAYGWGGAAGTNFWVDPANDIVGLFMVQSMPHQTDLARKFRVLTYQAFMQ